MPFYLFSQNNSGGKFRFSEEDGITTYVILEAPTAQQANIDAIMLGIYFDGCDSGVDCDCCGDRWYRVTEQDAEASPTIWGELLDSFWTPRCIRWMPPGKEACVHYADGKKEWFPKFVQGVLRLVAPF